MRVFSSNMFPIVQWEPPGNGNYIGEFSVEVLLSPPMFIEMKSPGWEAQLSQEQRDAGYAKQEKYQDLEGGADDPWRCTRMSVQKAYPKFLPSQPILLVIADDRFIPLATWGKLAAEQALFIGSTALDNEVGYFTTTELENLGGVGLFKAEDEVFGGLQYTFLLYLNPMARAETILPGSFIERFSNGKTVHLGSL